MSSYFAIGPAGFGAYDVAWTENGPTMHPSSNDPTGILTPGFVDLHVHGGFGIDLMAAPTEQMVELADKFEAHGIEGWLPTTISCSAEDAAGMLSRLPVHRSIWGIHLEGPFISPSFPGAQPPSAIVEATIGESGWNSLLSDPRIRIATLAPEIPGGLELIRRLSELGIIVSLGHTNATFEQASAGFLAGARHATHTYNAMRGLHHREPGMLGFAFTCDNLACELIYDRIHVSQPAADVLLRCKPQDRLLAVSDGTMATGLPPGTELTMWDLPCVVSERQVRLRSNGALAGSAITLADAFANLTQDFGAEIAIRMCSLNPRVALGRTEQPSTWIECDLEGNIIRIRRIGYHS